MNDTTPGDDDATTGGPVEIAPSRPIPRSYVAKIRPGAQCPPAPTGWTLEPAPSVSSARLTTLLSRYCAYRFQGGPGEVPPAEPVLAPAHVVDRLEPDYPIVLPQAHEYVRGTAGARHASFRQQMGLGRLGEIPLTGNSPYVAIVDTVAKNPGARWSSEPSDHHGLAMGGIVRTIRCDDEDLACEPRLIYANAFPESLDDRGSVWSLNLAVIDAIEQWRSLGSNAPLVLNMSVGWAWDTTDTERLDQRSTGLLNNFEGTADRDISVAEEATFLTLAWASCQGVLSVAAAGNTRGGACSESGPMAPAAWEALTPLSFGQCRTLLDPGDHAGLGPQADFEDDHRLVYAAGGVDQSGAPIVNARPLSQPGRVLYASMASVPVGDGEYSTPLTGTSVASASLAGIAAQYWALHPSLSAADVIDDLTKTCAQSDSVDGECVAPGDSVPRIRANTVLPLHYGPPSFSFVNPTGQTPTGQTPTGQTPSPHGTQFMQPRANGAFDSRECTAYSFTGAPTASQVSWPDLTPQPQNPICPSCSLEYTAASGATLDLDINPNYQTRIVDTDYAALELFLSSGSVIQIDLDLGLSQSPQCLTTSSPCTVSLSSYPHPDGGSSNQTLSHYIGSADVQSATLGFHVTSNGTTQLVSNEIDVFYP